MPQGNQYSPQLAALQDGGFVATWISDQGGVVNAYAQRHDANGVALGSPIQVNDAPVQYGYGVAVGR